MPGGAKQEGGEGGLPYENSKIKQMFVHFLSAFSALELSEYRKPVFYVLGGRERKVFQLETDWP